MSKKFDAGDPSLARFHVGAGPLAAAGKAFRVLLDEHEAGDWGEVTPEERAANEAVLGGQPGFVTSRKTLQGQAIVIKSEPSLQWTDVFLAPEYEQAKHLWRNKS